MSKKQIQVILILNKIRKANPNPIRLNKFEVSNLNPEIPKNIPTQFQKSNPNQSKR